MDLTIENITQNVQEINSQCLDRRFRYVLERVVVHLHDLVRETRLSTKEWMTALEFLTQVGQTCTEVRQVSKYSSSNGLALILETMAILLYVSDRFWAKEFILLSDVLGVSLLVDSIDHPKPKGATEGTVLGPFHTHEAKEAPNGGAIASDPDGQPLLVLGKVTDSAGQPIAKAKIDVWETDSKGFYDVQYSERNGPDGRAVLTSDKNGRFWFKAIVPVPYPIPSDGPVGKLLSKLQRHPYRPSHMHFMFNSPGYDPLIT